MAVQWHLAVPPGFQRRCAHEQPRGESKIAQCSLPYTKDITAAWTFVQNFSLRPPKS